MADKKRSWIETVIAWMLVLLGGYHTLRAVYDNLMLADMFSSAGLLMGLATSTMPVEPPPLALLAARHIRTLFMLYLLASVAAFSIGLGLLLRRSWARVSAKLMFYLIAACCFALLLFPGLLVPKPLIQDGIAISPGFNAAVAWLKFQLRLTAALAGAAALWAATRFESRPAAAAPVQGGQA